MGWRACPTSIQYFLPVIQTFTNYSETVNDVTKVQNQAHVVLCNNALSMGKNLLMHFMVLKYKNNY